MTKSAIEAYEALVIQPGKLDILNHWKNRSIPAGVMADIYDGEVWKEFLIVDGKEFLSSRYSLGFLLNVDCRSNTYNTVLVPSILLF